MKHYPIPINSSDTGALLDLSASGRQALGIAGGATLGYAFGKGKLIPMALGAGLGYVILETGILDKFFGSK